MSRYGECWVCARPFETCPHDVIDNENARSYKENKKKSKFTPVDNRSIVMCNFCFCAYPETFQTLHLGKCEHYQRIKNAAGR